MSRRGRAAVIDPGQMGLGIAFPVASPPPPPPPRAKSVQARQPAKPATPAPAPVVQLPATPWARVTAECPDGRGIDAHEIPEQRWTCTCGWSGDAAGLGRHRCDGIALLELRAWVHVVRAAGGPVRCVPGRIERVMRWDTLEFTRGRLERVVNEFPRRARFEPCDGLAYVDQISAAYSAAEEAGRRPCATSPVVAERRACGCRPPSTLCATARALVERAEQHRALAAATAAPALRNVWRRAFGIVDLVLSAHLRGVALSYAGGRWRATAIGEVRAAS